ncbi:hypothetical protein CSA37_06000 [Candidatus Fermentibacteria bacterium]|nr:MAG: hypothetical protein CSA37_06000 [Candidatus Fermentibacteria bacterium]
MPAFFLLIKIRKVIIPLPWFILWLLLLPLIPVAILISPFFREAEYRVILRNAHLAWWTTAALHGLKIDVNSKDGETVFLSFV